MDSNAQLTMLNRMLTETRSQAEDARYRLNHFREQIPDGTVMTMTQLAEATALEVTVALIRVRQDTIYEIKNQLFPDTNEPMRS